MSAPTIASEGAVYTPASPVECRVYERHPAVVATWCQPLAARGPADLKWSAQVENVSLGGIALVINRRFERGTGLAIELPDGTPDSTYTALAKVVRLSARPDGSWFHGCSFVGELSEDSMAALLQPAALPSAPPVEESVSSPDLAPAPAAPEQVSVAPAKAVPEPVLVRGVHFRCQVGHGRVLSRFVNRLEMKGPWPLGRGTVVRARMGRKSGTKYTVRMKVTHCLRQGESWTLACKFLETPPAEVLRLFPA